ncbi:hypothetical protein HMPREF1219_00749 [Corynebacterium pyruviciproducens ATCC BAA-1742]|uniref:DUF3099 domain-containing protein n=1 Tax=Corynebacterium pyruviciproducens ATCC BAA-1742 TaxID=1125779 RepID=S2Z7S3_9CORY|nr:DUF3099 domain-containing protein [Corynebacterium pyruviciproducens]EPD70310.1 hypothetical protein HMPREF1219_00749 [Corynebacterium pyruviciproducens ATCC BAA-1742]
MTGPNPGEETHDAAGSHSHASDFGSACGDRPGASDAHPRGGETEGHPSQDGRAHNADHSEDARRATDAHDTRDANETRDARGATDARETRDTGTSNSETPPDAEGAMVIDAEDPSDTADSDEGFGEHAKHWWATHVRRSSSVELITDQQKRTPWQNHEHRKVIYMWLQGMRIPFLVMSAISYLIWQNILLSWCLFLISIPLPWISVVIANGVGEPRDKREQNVYKPERIRAQQAHSAYMAFHAPVRMELEAPARHNGEEAPEPSTSPAGGEATAAREAASDSGA